MSKVSCVALQWNIFIMRHFIPLDYFAASKTYYYLLNIKGIFTASSLSHLLKYLYEILIKAELHVNKGKFGIFTSLWTERLWRGVKKRIYEATAETVDAEIQEFLNKNTSNLC